jgi:hypothetical protein
VGSGVPKEALDTKKDRHPCDLHFHNYRYAQSVEMRTCSKCKRLKPRPGVGKRSTWCSMCHAAWELRRSTPDARTKLYKRFDAKVRKTPHCWEWIGAKSDTGYGSIGVEGKTCHAHRLSYERYVGPIPQGMQIDHLCRNRACVNPDHLEAVSPKTNSRRGAQVALKTHCAQGHPWTAEHIYLRPGSDKKMCRTCSIERSRARHLRRMLGPSPETP